MTTWIPEHCENHPDDEATHQWDSGPATTNGGVRVIFGLCDDCAADTADDPDDQGTVTHFDDLTN